MLESNKIYCGDNVELCKQLDDGCIDLVVTSPPYNLGIRYENYADARPTNEYYDWCDIWLRHLFRVLKPDGRLCLNHYLSCGSSEKRYAPLMNLNYICENIGFKHHGIAIWDDRTLTKFSAWGSWLSASAPYINSPYEGILVMYKDRWKKDKKGTTQISKEEFMESCSGVWKLPPEKNRTDHPAPFPESLASRCIRLLSYEGDLVLDPFMGSGTTAKMALINQRKFIGFEISQEYVDLANKRIKGWMEQERLF